MAVSSRVKSRIERLNPNWAQVALPVLADLAWETGLELALAFAEHSREEGVRPIALAAAEKMASGRLREDVDDRLEALDRWQCENLLFVLADVSYQPGIALFKRLYTLRPDLRCLVLKELGWMRGREAQSFLIRVIDESKDYWLTRAAVMALGVHATTKATFTTEAKTFVRVWDSHGLWAGVRCAAIGELIRLAERRSNPGWASLAIEAMGSPHSETRAHGIELGFLLKAGRERIEFLARFDPVVRKVARRALSDWESPELHIPYQYR